MSLMWNLTSLALVIETAIFPYLFPRHSYAFSFFAFLLVHLLSITAWKILVWPLWLSPLGHLPGPQDNSLFMGQNRRVRNERSGIPHNSWINEIPNDGLIGYRMRFNNERVLLTSPKALSEVLVQRSYDFAKPYNLRFGLGRILGVGLVVAEGDEHKVQRRKLLPAFQYRHIKDLYPVFWSKAVELTDAIPVNHGHGSVVNITEWVTRATLDIIGVAGMGFNIGAIHNPDNPVSNAYRSVFEPSHRPSRMAMLRSFILVRLSRYVPIKRRDAMASASKQLKGIARELIQKKAMNVGKDGKVPSADIISVAMNSGLFDEEGLANQSLTFLAAGHETTATSMSWAILALCQNSEVQQRLRNEVQSSLPSPYGSEERESITAEQIDSLPYLQAVCNEILRFYPPAGMTRRIATRTTTILDQVIPKDTEIVISMRAINHSKALWGSDATEFNPERWIGPGRANSGGASNNFANMTFLHGKFQDCSFLGRS